jgi:putative transposase
MSSYRQILYHLIFRTRAGQRTLSVEDNSELYAYIGGIIKNKKCHLYRINGMPDHIHILSDLHPNIALADLMRDIKTSTSFWLKGNSMYPKFNGWASGYAALTYSMKEKDRLIEYIKNQQVHHRRVAFEKEYRKFIIEAGIQIDERFFP